MSESERRTELIEQLVRSLQPTGRPSSSLLHNPDVARPCNELIKYNRFLDTSPPTAIEIEWAQMMRRIRDSGQMGKWRALNDLSARLMTMDVQSMQRDYHQRLLAFLLAAAGNILQTKESSPRPAGATAAMGYDPETCTADKPQTSQPDTWTEDDADDDGSNDTAEGMVDGRRDGRCASSGSLSTWSGEEEDGLEGRVLPLHDADGGMQAFDDRDAIQTTRQRASQTPSLDADPISGLKARLLRDSAPLERRHRRMHSQPYAATSLPVTLAAASSGGHPETVLNPRQCFTEAEIATQAIHIMYGMDNPGAAFAWHEPTRSYRASKDAHTASMTTAATSAVLVRFAWLGTLLRNLQRLHDAVVGRKHLFACEEALMEEGVELYDKDAGDGQKDMLRDIPTVAAFVAAMGRKLQTIRGRLIPLLQQASGGALTLMGLCQRMQPIERQAVVLYAASSECRWRGGPAATATALLNSLYGLLSDSLLHAASDRGVTSSTLAYVFFAACKPCLDAVDIWMQKGELERIPTDSFIRAVMSEESPTRGRDGGDDDDDDDGIVSTHADGVLADDRGQHIDSEHVHQGIVPHFLQADAEGVLNAGATVWSISTHDADSKGDGEQTARCSMAPLWSPPFVSTTKSLHASAVSALNDVLQGRLAAFEAAQRATSGHKPTAPIEMEEEASRRHSDASAEKKLDMADETSSNGVYISEWMHLISRHSDPVTMSISMPRREDLPPLSALPSTAVELPSATIAFEKSHVLQAALEAGEHTIGDAMQQAAQQAYVESQATTASYVESLIPQACALPEAPQTPVTKACRAPSSAWSGGGASTARVTDARQTTERRRGTTVADAFSYVCTDTRDSSWQRWVGHVSSELTDGLRCIGDDIDDVDGNDNSDPLTFGITALDLPGTRAAEPINMHADSGSNERHVSGNRAFTGCDPGAVDEILKDAKYWAHAPALHALLDRCLLRALRESLQTTEKLACQTALRSGLEAQLASLRRLAAMAHPALQPFIDTLLTQCSTSRGVDGMSAFAVDAALQDAVKVADADLAGIAAINVHLEPLHAAHEVLKPAAAVITSPPSNSTYLSTTSHPLSISVHGSPTHTPGVSSLGRLAFEVLPAFPLNTLADEHPAFVSMHVEVCKLMLQLRWTRRSLVAVRHLAGASSMRAAADNAAADHHAHLRGRRRTNRCSATTTAASRKLGAVQHDMLQLVVAVEQHVLWQLDRLGEAFDAAIARCTSMRHVRSETARYVASAQRGCLLMACEGCDDSCDVLLVEALDCVLQHCIALHRSSLRASSNQLGRGDVAAAESSRSDVEGIELLEALAREFKAKRARFVGVLCKRAGFAGEDGDYARALLAGLDPARRISPPGGGGR